jgi:hypothetical protein
MSHDKCGYQPHPVGLNDLVFQTAPVLQMPEGGEPFTKWVRAGMPKIPRYVIDTAFYLYETRADAVAGENPQGTGFVLGLPPNVQAGKYADRSQWHIYGVANWHVAIQRDKEITPAPVIRLNTRDGGVHVMNFYETDWRFIEGGPDLAVIPLDIDFEKHRVSMIPHVGDFFASKSDLAIGNIGVGEDVFMFGLFVDHGGIERNAPSARFGNISMLPSEDAKILQQNGYPGECFVLDMHSRTGFSGSPVFVYRTFGSDLTKPVEQQARIRMGVNASRAQTARNIQSGQFDLSVEATERILFKFLGIHHGQFPEDYDIERGVPEGKKRHLVSEGDRVVGMSGMTTVIPTWELEKVLNLPELKEIRDQKDEAIKQAAQARRKAVPKAEKPASKAGPRNDRD